MKPKHLTQAQLQCILDAQPKYNLYHDELPRTAARELVVMLLCLFLMLLFAGMFR